jgi:glucosyl-3-phosphoglycerate synthase
MSEEGEVPKVDVTVIFPAKNEVKTIASCISAAKQSKYSPKILVVDGYSTDGTAEEARKAGAEVILPSKRIHPGKGLAMKTGVKAALEKGTDIIVFMDSDIENLSSEWVDRLVDTITIEGYDMSRGAYFREPQDAPITKLVAKRLLGIFFPEIAHMDQPLTGEVAAKSEVWKALLEQDLPDGWGIDVTVLIEAEMLGFRIKEIWLGFKHHRSFRAYKEDVGKLWRMSEQVAAAIIQRAKKYGRIDNVDEFPT